MMKKIILAIATIAIFISCEKTVIVDVPVAAPKLVVNGIVQANNVFAVNVGKSEAVLSSTGANSFKVTNATVQLYENGLLKDSFLYNSTNNNYVAKNGTLALTGKTYKLTAAVNGFTTVDAETTTPSNIAIQSITRIVNARTDANGNTQDEVKIKFADNGNETNYYLFKIKKPYYNNGAQVLYDIIYCIKSNDVDIDRTSNSDPTDINSCIDREFLMTDKNFNGGTKTITLFIDSYNLTEYINPFNQKKYKTIVEINSIAKNYYNYRRSLQTYRDNEDNPFSEPVLVYSNINNGYGIFSSFTVGRDTIR
jgi:Domain of unknown function (DUF4249)